MMSTGFNTQTGGGHYRLQFETDNEEYFLLMQELARCCVDHPKVKTNGDKIRAMSDEELAVITMCPNNFGAEIDCFRAGSCAECCTKWLKQPAEENAREE